MFKEFQAFITRGNVIDLAVGIIIGGAFSTIVSSLVNDIIMPPIGVLLNGVDFTELFIVLSDGEYATLEEAQTAGAATLNYGIFLGNVINFLIIAYAVFLLVRFVNRFRELYAKPKDEGDAKVPAEPTTEERLVNVLEKLEQRLAEQPTHIEQD